MGERKSSHLSGKTFFPMPKMKARAVQNDKGEDTGKPKYSVGNPSMAEIKNEQQNPSVKRIVLYLKI